MCLVTSPIGFSCLELQEMELGLEGTCMFVGDRQDIGEKRRAGRAKGNHYPYSTWWKSQWQGKI